MVSDGRTSPGGRRAEVAGTIDPAVDPTIDPAIEREYNLRARHPEREAVYRRFAEASAAYRDRAGGLRDQRYADGPRCLLDFYPATATGAGTPAPLLVFVHGGYWRALDKEIFAFVAEPYAASGVSVALIGYDLAPAVTLAEIVAETEAAMQWLGRAADGLGVRRDGVVLSGHSAGAHLCAVLASRPADRLGDLTVGAVAGLSGVYDLRPLLRASLNRDVRMTPADCEALSPIGCTHFTARRFLLAVGELETDGFRSQSLRFAAHLAALGHAADAPLIPGRTHFDILDDFADPRSDLFATVLSLCQPARPPNHPNGSPP